MTNPDQWRHQQGAAPHAPAHAPQTPGLPLGGSPSSPADDSFGAPVSSGGGSGAGVVILKFIIVLVFAGPIFGGLYPMATGLAVAAGFTATGLLRGAASLSESDRTTIGAIVALVAFWPLMRLDHRLAATIPPYRLGRHVLRLVLIGGYVSLVTMNESGPRFMPTSFAQARFVFSDPKHLVALAVGAVAAHLWLTRWTASRARWERALEIFRLRPANLG
jgi:hypothetical protein